MKKYLIGWEKWRNPYSFRPKKTKLGKSIVQENYPAITTPMGVLPLNEASKPERVFNLWIGHTNFPITHHIADIIGNTDGVESLDIHTKYRMRVGIGKMFDSQQVRYNIGLKVSDYLHAKEKE